MRNTAWWWAAILAATSLGACDGASAQTPDETAAPPEAPPPALRLPRALELAQASHRGLAAARHELAASRAARVQAGARPNPQFEFERQGTRGLERETTLRLAQPVELGGKRAARLAAAELGEAIAQQRLLARTAELRAQLTLAFHEAALAQERERLAEAGLALASATQAATARRVDAGQLAPVEARRAQVAEASARLEQVQALGQRRAALARLAALVGEPPSRVQAVEADEGMAALPPLPDPEQLPGLLREAPLQRQAALEAQRQAALARLARAERMPDLTLSLGSIREEASGRSRALIGLALPLPVFDTRRPAEDEAMLRARQAEDEAQASAAQLAAQVSLAFERLRAARQEVEMLDRELLPGALETQRAAARGFELGKFGQLEALDAQRTLHLTRQQRLRALAEAHAATADLQRLLGNKESIP